MSGRLALGLGARGAAAFGLAALALLVVGSVAGGARARASLLETRARTYERLALADLEWRLSPTERGVLDGVVPPRGVAAMEERAVAFGRFTGGTARDLPSLVRVLPAAGPPQIDRLEIEPGGHYPGPDEPAVVVDRSLAVLHGVRRGDEILLRLGDETLRLPVVGIALSPEHLFAPSHPSYGLVLRGTAGALGLSEAAVRGKPRATKVTSLLFRFEPGADAAEIERGLRTSIARHVRESVPQDRDPGRMFSDFLLRTFDLYLPTIVGGLGVVGLLLVALLVARGVDRRRREIGLRLALGETRTRIAASFARFPLVATALGALAGAWAHGPVAATTAGAWAGNMGFPPLVDAGPRWAAVGLASAACLLTAALAGAGPALWLAGRRPARLLHDTALGARGAPGRLARGGARLATWLRLAPVAALALAGVVRRRRESAGAILAVALATALVLALLAVNVSHRVESRATLVRSTLDATVHLLEPADGAALDAVAARLEGRAEPLVARSVRAAVRDRLETRRLLGVSVHGWLATQPLAAGRLPAADDAAEALVDLWVAHQDGLAVGDTLRLFPDPDAPEGLDVRIVGLLDGLSVGRVLLPIGAARRLYGLGSASTGLLVASGLPADVLEERAAALPGAELAYTAARAAAQADSAFTGSSSVLRLALVAAVFMALLILGVLALDDARERAPEAALLSAMGWSRASLAGVTVGEVLARGIPALALAGLLAAPLAGAFLARVEAVNGYRVALHLPPWLLAAVLVPGLLLLPLAALPALAASRRAAPARVLRTLVPE